MKTIYKKEIVNSLALFCTIHPIFLLKGICIVGHAFVARVHLFFFLIYLIYFVVFELITFPLVFRIINTS